MCRDEKYKNRMINKKLTSRAVDPRRCPWRESCFQGSRRFGANRRSAARDCGRKRNNGSLISKGRQSRGGRVRQTGGTHAPFGRRMQVLPQSL